MSRDYDPVPGKWYEDLETEEIFKVLSLDPDEELVRIQWLDRELEDLDLDVWNEMDLELASEPEGWADDDAVADGADDPDDEELDWAISVHTAPAPWVATRSNAPTRPPASTTRPPTPTTSPSSPRSSPGSSNADAFRNRP